MLSDLIVRAKWSAKSLWALVLPVAIPLVNEAAEWLSDQSEMWITAVATAVVVWLQKNGPKPE